jgi:putative ABC transport system substrate-binding protein
MQRREFITLFGGTAATWPLAAGAQQPAGRGHRVGYLAIGSREQQLYLITAFEEGLRSLGYRVGENVVIEYRFADDRIERLPALARELVLTRSMRDLSPVRVVATDSVYRLRDSLPAGFAFN